MSETREPRNSLDDIPPKKRAPADSEARRRWMAEFAQADGAEFRDKMATFLQSRPAPDWRWIRRPEIGLVMTRGRIGGEGAPFNLGEISVTRCALRLESGEEGVAYVLGRAPGKAEQAALADAMMQTDAADALEEAVLEPLRAALARRRAAAAAEAEATRVEFFTLVRGDDE